MARDVYSDFATLAAAEKRGEDYRVWHDNRGTPVVVLAPHGGAIEPGTSEIAKAIAGTVSSIYTFEGLKAGRAHHELHIASHLFDEPDALKLVASGETAIAIHGRQDKDTPGTVSLGGQDAPFRDALAASLEAAGFPVAMAPPGLAAQDRSNICNRGRFGAGVQLELPRSLRRRLMRNAALLRAFSNAVREAIAGRDGH